MGIDGLCVRCGCSDHTQSDCKADSKKLRCTSCSHQGHVTKVCISTLVKIQRSKSSESKQLEAEALYDCQLISEFSTVNLIVDVYQHGSVDHKDTEKFFTEALIQGKRQKFEVDTGTGLTLLPVDQLKRLRLNVKLQPTAVRFWSYTSNIFEPIGVVKVPVQYRNIVSTEIMFIVPSGYDAFVIWSGMDPTSKNKTQ